MKLLKVITIYSCTKLLIVLVFYQIVMSQKFMSDYDEAFSQDPEYSPVWALHVDSDWGCVDTDDLDLSNYYESGLCSLEIGAENTAYFLGDSHTGHLRGLIDQLVKNKDVNIFHTYKYSCPYANFADQGCLNFYRTAFDWIKNQVVSGDSIVLSYFYRPFVDDWGDYNVPRKRIAPKLVEKNLQSMLAFVKNLNQEFEDLDVNIIWILNGPSPSVAPFILKDQNRWPYFIDDRIAGLNQKIKAGIGNDVEITLLDLEVIWNKERRNLIADDNTCQRIGDRDNHHISYKYAMTIYKYFPHEVLADTDVSKKNKIYNILC